MNPRAERDPVPIEAPDTASSWQRRWTPRLIIWAILLGLLVVFIVQNFEHVEVRMIAWDVDLRLAWAFLISGVVGFLLGLLLPRLRR